MRKRRHRYEISARRASLAHRREQGQSVIILALSFLALLAFVGLVTDVGALYVTYTQLKRAVDAAAIAAANNIKYPQDTAEERKEKITEAAREMLQLHNVEAGEISGFEVFLCDDDDLPADFVTMCPQDADEMPRKLAYVQATQDAPVYFLHLFGIQSIPFTTSAVGEAASVDLVLVFDTSESMGINSPGYDPNDFNPSSCNTSNTCQPLLEAKNAAKGLIANLFHGYDQVAVVTFDYDAQVIFNLSENIGDDDGASDGDAFAAIDQFVRLHDDAPAGRLTWYSPPTVDYPSLSAFNPPLNPSFPDDRDGNGSDNDPGAPCVDLVNNLSLLPEPDLFDDTTWMPCDNDSILDAYDWNNNDIHTDDGGFTSARDKMSLLSTCSGCGIRAGTAVLQDGGRHNSLWVMVFLSDGIANLSDTPATWSEIPSSFKYGFCGHDPANAFWSSFCIDKNTGSTAGRYCIDSDSSECPPGTTSTTTSKPYSVEDYAKDMVDAAALLESENNDEPLGEDIIIYAIGLGAASNGEDLLRYMANVGEDGTRENDECDGVPAGQNCGNYYYAPNVSYLAQIFESVATRIFTKISR